MTDDSKKTPNDDPDAYRILASTGSSELKIQGSLFLGHAHPVETEQLARAIVDDARSQHYDATHVCYGLRVGLGASRIDRSNDDGEPARSAGYPIWQVLSGDEIDNALIYVIRYYGGTKLGVGGLKRAYRDTARAALTSAGIAIHHQETLIRFNVSYAAFDELERFIDDLQSARITDRSFTADVDIELAIWTSQVSMVKKRLKNLLGRSLDELFGSNPPSNNA